MKLLLLLILLLAVKPASCITPSETGIVFLGDSFVGPYHEPMRYPEWFLTNAPWNQCITTNLAVSGTGVFSSIEAWNTIGKAWVTNFAANGGKRLFVLGGFGFNDGALLTNAASYISIVEPLMADVKNVGNALGIQAHYIAVTIAASAVSAGSRFPEPSTWVSRNKFLVNNWYRSTTNAEFLLDLQQILPDYTDTNLWVTSPSDPNVGHPNDVGAIRVANELNIVLLFGGGRRLPVSRYREGPYEMERTSSGDMTYLSYSNGVQGRLLIGSSDLNDFSVEQITAVGAAGFKNKLQSTPALTVFVSEGASRNQGVLSVKSNLLELWSIAADGTINSISHTNTRHIETYTFSATKFSTAPLIIATDLILLPQSPAPQNVVLGVTSPDVWYRVANLDGTTNLVPGWNLSH